MYMHLEFHQVNVVIAYDYQRDKNNSLVTTRVTNDRSIQVIMGIHKFFPIL